MRPLLLVCVLALGAPVTAQEDAGALAPLPETSPVHTDLVIERFSAEDGLPNNSVVGIVQDSVGFLWLGTQDGLVRYDGATLQVFTNEPGNPRSLSHSRVAALFVDPQGRLWVGTFGGGLNRFDAATETFTRYLHDPADPTSLSDKHVQALCEE